MKKFFALLAVVLAVVSCQKDVDVDVNVGGEVDTTITVSLPETTRANSAEGAFDNVVGSDEYTIRYIFQVFYNGTESKAARQVIYSDNKVVCFPVRLVPDRDYNFVVWADVVMQDGKSLDQLGVYDASADLHYNTAELTNITLNKTWIAMDETRDAFTGHFDTAVDGDKTPYNGVKSINIRLTRPFAKLRIITTDMEQLNDLGIAPTKATVEYTVDHYNAFNAFAGQVINDSKNRDIKHENFYIKAYGDNVDDKSKVLFTDYFFAADQEEVVNFTLKVYDQYGVIIGKETNFNTPIPARRNNLTTIAGNILTKGNNVTVTVDPVFAGKQEWPSKEAEKLAAAAMFGGTVTLTENVTLTEPLMVAADMVVNLNGYTITYTGDDVLFRVNGATVTINGTVKGSAIVTVPTAPGEGGNGYVGLVKDGGTLNINGGTYNGKKTCTIAQVSKGTLNVYGGTFCVSLEEWTDANGEARYLLNCSDTPYKNSEAVVNVYGGTFYKFNPANNAAEGTGTNFVAEGYKAVKKGDNYVVVPQIVASLANVTENTTVELKNDITVSTGTTIHTENASADITINGNGNSIISTAESADDFTWEGGTFPAMSTILSSSTSQRTTIIVNDLNFEGTISALMLGHYYAHNSNNNDIFLNNVNVINTKVVSFSANVSPAVCVYGKATLNNCQITGTTLSELETSPMWELCDIAVVNDAVLTLKGGKVGKIIAWAKSMITVDNNAVVECIKPISQTMNTDTKYGVTVKAGATVKVLDLSNIALDKKKINITIEKGATVGKIIDANGTEYSTLEAFKSAE